MKMARTELITATRWRLRKVLPAWNIWSRTWN